MAKNNRSETYDMLNGKKAGTGMTKEKKGVRLEHVLMEFVAQLVERQNVDLMVAGSNPVKLP